MTEEVPPGLAGQINKQIKQLEDKIILNATTIEKLRLQAVALANENIKLGGGIDELKKLLGEQEVED